MTETDGSVGFVVVPGSMLTANISLSARLLAVAILAHPLASRRALARLLGVSAPLVLRNYPAALALAEAAKAERSALLASRATAV